MLYDPDFKPIKEADELLLDEFKDLKKELLAELKAIRAELKDIKAIVKESSSITESEVDAKYFI